MVELTDKEIESFHNNGFLIIRGFYDQNEIKEIRNWVYDYADRKPDEWESGKEMAYFETSKNDGTRILARIENFLEFHGGFKNLVNSKKLTDCVESLLGKKAVLFKEKINFKKPGGGGFKPHQDQISRWETYAQDFLNILISTDDSNIENGCIELTPGFYKKELLGPLDSPIPEKWLNQMEFKPFPLDKGDIVFFDGYAPHQSQDNKSLNSRSNVYLTYNSISQGDQRKKYFTRKRKELPPDNERKENFKDSPLHDYK